MVFEARMLVFLSAIDAILIWIISHRHIPAKKPAQEKLAPRPLKPRTAEACQECRATHPEALHPRPLPKPYWQVKSRRGSKKRLSTAGCACPNSDCLCFGITDDQIHALVGCGHHTCTCATRKCRCAPTKLMPVLKLGPRTQATAHAVVYALVKILAPQHDRPTSRWR